MLPPWQEGATTSARIEIELLLLISRIALAVVTLRLLFELHRPGIGGGLRRRHQRLSTRARPASG